MKNYILKGNLKKTEGGGQYDVRLLKRGKDRDIFTGRIACWWYSAYSIFRLNLEIAFHDGFTIKIAIPFINIGLQFGSKNFDKILVMLKNRINE